jgi:hypothetical protein
LSLRSEKSEKYIFTINVIIIIITITTITTAVVAVVVLVVVLVLMAVARALVALILLIATTVAITYVRNGPKVWRMKSYIPEDTTLHNPCCENLKSHRLENTVRSTHRLY